MAAEEAVEQGQCEEADVIIVDPPRKGLDDEVIQLLTNSHPTAVAKSKMYRSHTVISIKSDYCLLANY